MPTPPAFIKQFSIGDNERMKIPQAFILQSLGGQNVRGIMPLKDRYGNIWRVKVSKINNDSYFTNGWTKLVSDNSITSGDFLFFEYFPEDLFTFKLMGPSGTEKGGVGLFIHDIPQENIEQEDQIEDDDDPNLQNEDIDVDAADAHRVPQPRRVNYNLKCYAMGIFNAGLAPQPRNPYFVVKFKPKRKADLFVPSKVIENHNLDLDQISSFVDPTGRQYPARCKTWTDGRKMIADGWKPLCEANNVREGDRCICEFLQRGDEDLVLSISFVRRQN